MHVFIPYDRKKLGVNIIKNITDRVHMHILITNRGIGKLN